MSSLNTCSCYLFGEDNRDSGEEQFFVFITINATNALAIRPLSASIFNIFQNYFSALFCFNSHLLICFRLRPKPKQHLTTNHALSKSVILLLLNFLSQHYFVIFFSINAWLVRWPLFEIFTRLSIFSDLSFFIVVVTVQQNITHFFCMDSHGI